MSGTQTFNNHNENVNPKFEDPNLYWQRNTKIDTNDWLYTLNDLDASPSVKTAYGLKQEIDRYRLSQDRIIQACKMLNLGKVAIFCSMIYLQRFYQRFSMKEFSTTSISAACLYIACKKLEMHRNIKQVSAAYARLITGRFNRTDEVPEDVLWRTRDELEMNEDFVLSSLCFDLRLTNPYQYIEDILSPKGYDYRVIKTFTIAKIESLTTSQIFLIFEIEKVILSLLTLSALLKDIRFPKNHFEEIGVTIDPDEVLEIKETIQSIYKSRELPSTALDDVLNLQVEKEDIVELVKGSLSSPPSPLPQSTNESKQEPETQHQLSEKQNSIPPTSNVNTQEESQESKKGQNQIQAQETSSHIPLPLQNSEKEPGSIESPKIVKNEPSPHHEELQDSEKNKQAIQNKAKTKLDKPQIVSKSIDLKNLNKENENLKSGSIGTKSKIFAASKSPFTRSTFNTNTGESKPSSVFGRTKSPSPQKKLFSPIRDSFKQDRSEPPKQQQIEAKKSTDGKMSAPASRVLAPISRPKASSPATDSPTGSAPKKLLNKKDDQNGASTPKNNEEKTKTKKISISIPQPSSKERKPSPPIAQPRAKRTVSATSTNTKASNKRQATEKKPTKEKIDKIFDLIPSDLSDLSD